MSDQDNQLLQLIADRVLEIHQDLGELKGEFKGMAGRVASLEQQRQDSMRAKAQQSSADLAEYKKQRVTLAQGIVVAIIGAGVGGLFVLADLILRR